MQSHPQKLQSLQGRREEKNEIASSQRQQILQRITESILTLVLLIIQMSLRGYSPQRQMVSFLRVDLVPCLTLQKVVLEHLGHLQ